MYSIFDLFKVGVGPSSSHTVGPMIAAFRFARDCITFMETKPDIARVQVSLYGSLALTGVGHATDIAILAGLSGCLPDRTDPVFIRDTTSKTRSERVLQLGGVHTVPYDEKTDLLWLRNETLPQHPNAMHFRAYDNNGEMVFEDQYFSTGGGFVYSRTEFQDQFQSSQAEAGSTATFDSEPYPFTSAKQLVELCRQHNLSIDELIQRNELSKRTADEIREKLDLLWDVMSECIQCGCRAQGLLPGSLKVPRRSPEIFRKLAGNEQAAHNVPGASLPPARPTTSMMSSATKGKHVDPLHQLDWVSLFALAVNEENAAGGRVVTAPTNGAAGIIPAVLAYYVYFYPNADQEGVYRFLRTAGAIGLLYKRNASLSAAEMGCQGEVGVACSMAAAGLAACMGGTVEQIENAAEIGMEHNLGLTCDPIGGLVQVPCIERNTMGATKAINAARLAVLYGDGKHFVSLDRVIETMRQTGIDMQVKYKETSLGGLAVNVVDC